MPEDIVRFEKICKSFSGVSVLRDIDLSLIKGEILGIIGENGAGKSTLMKILSGIYQPTSGQVFLENNPVFITDPIEARRLGISLVPQEFNLIRDLPIYNNIFLGAELMTRLGTLDKVAMKRRTSELLAQLGVDISVESTIENLSAAQKQMVEISKALAFSSHVLIMDEPTTMLTIHEIEVLFNLTKRLKAEGMTIVYISHKLKEVKALCDRVVVLRDGELVFDSPTRDVTVVEMAQRMVGRDLGSIFPPRHQPSDDVVFEVRNVTVPGVIEDISFTLRKGEILGLAGLVGAGRTEVAETILGLRKKTSGTLVKDGRDITIDDPNDAVAAGISYLSEDRQGAGIITSFSVANNTTLVSLPSYSRNSLRRINKRMERQKVTDYINSFHIKTDSQDKRLENLSGGNQQKVSLAKSIDTQPVILIVDEPTRGVDISAKHEIYLFINELVTKGLSCIFISSELEEIIGMSNRVVVMRDRRVAGVLEGADITEEKIMYLATGAHEEINA